MRGLRSCLLQASARLREFAPTVIEFSRAEEPSRTRDGDLVDSEIDTENRSVLGRRLELVVLRFAEAEVQIPVFVSVVERTLRILPLVAVQEFVLIAISSVWQRQIRADSRVITERRERHLFAIVEHGHRSRIERDRSRCEPWLARFPSVIPFLVA